MRRRPRGRMDDDDLNSHLLKAFASRFHALSVAALNAAVAIDVSAQTAKLTLCERQRALPHPPARRACASRPRRGCLKLCISRAVFDAGRDAMRSYANWRNNKTKIEQSQLVAHRKKRKSRK